ncbi:pterocarpan synthase 1-like [Rutidosis leptorrhynchoides]|uniref:pterocarpan synthase 1-like n=1 Tax=Rutidosis leptorrhynchoides TaxID=125765 RepID=UPI003A98CFB2
MAQSLPKYTTFILFLFSFLLKTQSHKYSEKLSPKSLGFKTEKLTHLHFYLHDIIGGDHPTAVLVAQPPKFNTSNSVFGATFVIDDPLTMGPDQSSKIVGRAQGMYTFASLNEFRLLMVMDFVFVKGKYNGSTLSIIGLNYVPSPVREMPIVSGSGIFRFARGYALANTHFINMTSGNAVVEYNVFVLHY